VLLEDLTKISALGLGDVLRQYFTFRKIFFNALVDCRAWQPDLIILIDSPAFNLRFAKQIKKEFPVVYYISPQFWAWGKRRISVVKKFVDKMLVILPFEAQMYDEAGVDCEFVGNPLLDSLPDPEKIDRTELRNRFEIGPDQLAIGLLSGSRKREVTRILPLMLKSAVEMRKRISNAVFFVTHAPNIDKQIYDEIITKFPDLAIRRLDLPKRKAFHDLVAALDFALITSGTATLEAALIGTPFFLLYKAAWSTYFLGRQLIRVPYLGLVNLLSGKRVVPEFIQRDIRPVTIAHEARVLLEHREFYEGMKNEFRQVREGLGEKGASGRAAKSVLEFLSSNKSSQTGRGTLSASHSTSA